MKKPEITLKSIKTHSGLSQKTHAYTATVYVNGKRWGEASNAGHGGPDDCYADAGGFEAYRELNDLVKTTYPKRWVGSEYFPEGVECDLEILCHELVEDHLFEKKWKGKLSRQIIAIENGEVYEWPRKVKANEATLAKIQEQYPEATILNNLPREQALALLRLETFSGGGQ